MEQWNQSIQHVGISRLMATQAARHSRFVGALFLHFDMWVNVWRLHLSLPFGSVWMPQNGVARATRTTYSDPRCFAVRKTSRRRRAAGSLVDYNHSLGRYPWHMGSMPACVAAVKKLGETQCCYGWTDLVYVPTPVVGLFAEVCETMDEVFHEVAIPTAVYILTRRSRVPLHLLRCDGSCCVRLPPPPARPNSTSKMCGHKFSMRTVAARKSFARFMGAREVDGIT